MRFPDLCAWPLLLACLLWPHQASAVDLPQTMADSMTALISPDSAPTIWTRRLTSSLNSTRDATSEEMGINIITQYQHQHLEPLAIEATTLMHAIYRLMELAEVV